MVSVKDLRKNKGIAPPQMAAHLNIALSTYFDKEAGRRKFQPHEIAFICKYFKQKVENISDFQKKSTRQTDARKTV